MFIFYKRFDTGRMFFVEEKAGSSKRATSSHFCFFLILHGGRTKTIEVRMKKTKTIDAVLLLVWGRQPMLLDGAYGIRGFIAAGDKEVFAAVESSDIVRADRD